MSGAKALLDTCKNDNRVNKVCFVNKLYRILFYTSKNLCYNDAVKGMTQEECDKESHGGAPCKAKRAPKPTPAKDDNAAEGGKQSVFRRAEHRTKGLVCAHVQFI